MSDTELLARLIKCEAGGEGDTGMRAVATVVANRINAVGGEYSRQPDLRSVVFAPRQFECAEMRLQSLYNAVPEQIHYDIAEWALNGGRLNAVGNSLWFYNPFSEACAPNFPSQSGEFAIRIGEHCFYTPTAAYYST